MSMLSSHSARSMALFIFLLVTLAMAFEPGRAEPIVDRLDRGVVATPLSDGKVFVSWRLLASDPARTAFNVYRTTAGQESDRRDYGPYASRPDVPFATVKLNDEPLTGGTWILDADPALQHETTYVVRPVVDGAEVKPAGTFTLAAGAPPWPYRAVPLQTPPGCNPGDASVGDLDGDGEYEIVIKQEQDPADITPKTKSGHTRLQAYKLDGTLLWTIDLGLNIREGAHTTSFIVYDLDGDGKAEVACKTADGTIDGAGKAVGDATAVYRADSGQILRGPEFLTVFDGPTGAARATVPYVPARHPTNPLNPTAEELKKVWGDGRGNRSERYLAGVAYLDGTHPSLIMARGYYTRIVITAWDWRGGKLAPRWTFDSDASPENRPYEGQGYHCLSIADVDNDGKDEIVYGSMVVDDNGKGLYSTGWGHGDALHVSDFVPSNQGLEIMGIQEPFGKEGLHLRDAKTGRALLTVPSEKAASEGGDKGEGPGRGVAFDIDPRFPGAEVWGIGAGITGVYSAGGERRFDRPPDLPANFAVWWDGDLLRELLDQNFIVKWNPQTGRVERLLTAHGSTSINGTKATPVLSADLYGDWREEVIWLSRDKRELRIYTSTIPTPHRLVTLMQNPQYRVAIAWQNVDYNQPPHPSIALTEGQPLPTPPKVSLPGKDQESPKDE